jgi:hypothetical protein
LMKQASGKIFIIIRWIHHLTKLHTFLNTQINYDHCGTVESNKNYTSWATEKICFRAIKTKCAGKVHSGGWFLGNWRKKSTDYFKISVEILELWWNFDAIWDLVQIFLFSSQTQNPSTVLQESIQMFQNSKLPNFSNFAIGISK